MAGDCVAMITQFSLSCGTYSTMRLCCTRVPYTVGGIESTMLQVWKREIDTKTGITKGHIWIGVVSCSPTEKQGYLLRPSDFFCCSYWHWAFSVRNILSGCTTDCTPVHPEQSKKTKVQLLAENLRTCLSHNEEFPLTVGRKDIYFKPWPWIQVFMKSTVRNCICPFTIFIQ